MRKLWFQRDNVHLLWKIGQKSIFYESHSSFAWKDGACLPMLQCTCVAWLRDREEKATWTLAIMSLYFTWWRYWRVVGVCNFQEPRKPSYIPFWVLHYRDTSAHYGKHPCSMSSTIPFADVHLWYKDWLVSLRKVRTRIRQMSGSIMRRKLGHSKLLLYASKACLYT